MASFSGSYAPHHDAAILDEYGVRVEYLKNGLWHKHDHNNKEKGVTTSHVQRNDTAATVKLHDAFEHAARADHARNGLFPHHPDIQLREKKRFGGWKTMRESYPRCDHDHMKTQGPPAPTTPMPLQPPSPATQFQPSTQILTTSISSTIAKLLSEMQMMNRMLTFKKEVSWSLRTWRRIMTTTR